MKYIFLFLSMITFLYSQEWYRHKSPESISHFNKIESGSNFIVGISFDPYFSFDSGKTWEKRVNGLPEFRGSISKIVVEDDVVFIYTQNSFSIKEEYFYYSTNKGLDWKKVGEFQEYAGSNLIRDFKVQNGIIYTLPFGQKYIMKSENYGKNWDTLQSWDNSVNFMDYIAVSNDTIVVADGGASNAASKGVLISYNGGNTWTKKKNGLDLSSITCLEIQGNNIYVGTKNGFYYSQNFGESYRRSSSLAFDRYINDIEITDQAVYLATETGLLKSVDLWKDWIDFTEFKLKRIYDLHKIDNKLLVTASNLDYSNYFSYISNVSFGFDLINFEKESQLSAIYIEYPKIYITTNNFSYNNIYYQDSLNKNNQSFDNLTNIDIANIIDNVDKKNKIIACSLPLFIPNGIQNKILLSIDEGLTWEIIDVLDVNTRINDLIILNKDTILVSTSKGIYLSNIHDFNWLEYDTKNSSINNDLSLVRKIERIGDKLYFYGDGRIFESDFNLKNWKSILNKYDYSQTDSLNYIYSRNIFEFSKFKEKIVIVSFKGQYVEPSTVSLNYSDDNGKTWKNISHEFFNNPDLLFFNVLNIENYIFVSTNMGVFISEDDGNNFIKISNGLLSQSIMADGEFHIYNDKLIYFTSYGLYEINLNDIGVQLTSVEKTEQRNYLYTFPPFPQPTKQEVKISTYWDSALPFTIDDVEIYNLAGIKINTENKLSINKETNYNGHIIWDTSGEQAGIYIVNIKHGTETRTQKVMVEK